MNKIKNKIRFSSILILLLMMGCDSYVELEPRGEISSNYFNSEEEYEKALIGAYDMLQITFWNTLSATMASDDIIAGGDPSNEDQPTLQRIDKMGQTQEDNNQLRDIWGFMYAGINRANYILEFKDKTAFSGRDEIIAQAYFLRAYFTFELAKWFGDIPLSTENRDGVERILNKRTFVGEEYTIDRVGSIAAVYSLIEEDLKEAIVNLPESQVEKYEITKGAAQALLGKVYLYHGKFDNSKFSKAAVVFNQVINSAKYQLADYNVLFTPAGENGVEAVFEIQYTNVEGASWACIQCSEGNYMPKFNAPRAFTNTTYMNGWGFSLPTQALFDAFKSGDKRRNVTILDLRGETTYGLSRENTGFFTKKYLPTKIDESERIGNDPLNFQNNYRSIRYADVLLMQAEAVVQSGGASGEVSLNKVRARAFGNSSHDFPYNGESNLLDAIYAERRVELAGEGHRFFDLVRTGRAKTAFDAYNSSKASNANAINYVENKNEIFPIPLVELELANAVARWGQNPGY
jgi:hypothetical protein